MSYFTRVKKFNPNHGADGRFTDGAGDPRSDAQRATNYTPSAASYENSTRTPASFQNAANEFANRANPDAPFKRTNYTPEATAYEKKTRAISPQEHQRQLNSDNWHTRTMAKMRDRSEASLQFITRDANEAAANMERMGSGPKAGQYRDEAHYAQMELRRRQVVSEHITGGDAKQDNTPQGLMKRFWANQAMRGDTPSKVYAVVQGQHEHQQQPTGYMLGWSVNQGAAQRDLERRSNAPGLRMEIFHPPKK